MLKQAQEPPEHALIIPKWSPQSPKIGQKSTHVDSFSYMNLSWAL